MSFKLPKSLKTSEVFPHSMKIALQYGCDIGDNDHGSHSTKQHSALVCGCIVGSDLRCRFLCPPGSCAAAGVAELEPATDPVFSQDCPQSPNQSGERPGVPCSAIAR